MDDKPVIKRLAEFYNQYKDHIEIVEEQSLCPFGNTSALDREDKPNELLLYETYYMPFDGCDGLCVKLGLCESGTCPCFQHGCYNAMEILRELLEKREAI